jgi:hypothetical protein
MTALTFPNNCRKCIRYENIHFCLICKLFYENNPTYFENLYKEK